jgi:hypothetical protein
MLEQRQGGMTTVETSAAAEAGTAPLVRSRTPTVYVPHRFRIGGIEGIRTGAAIVGTPQGDGMVAIDVESTAYVEPNPEVWTTWIAEAARRHSAEGEDEMLIGEESQTRLVSEAALVEVGKCIQGRVLIDDASKGAALSRWIQAGRADYVVDGYLPGESGA